MPRKDNKVCKFSCLSVPARGLSMATDLPQTGESLVTYQNAITELRGTIDKAGAPWDAIDAEAAARMQVQNRFPTGLDIARYTARIMREDMEAYDADPANKRIRF